MNISQIAKIAGVAPATVSRYLNNGYVSSEKREKIREVIAQTGYIPSAAAQTMRTKRNMLIGVIVPKLSSESVARMVDGITQALGDSGYNIILANTSNNYEKELDFLQIFRDNIVDGVILIGTIITKRHHEIMLGYGQKPIVILSQFDQKYPCVYFDDYGAAFEITRHLIDCGAKSIANICVTQRDKAAGASRINGFRDALAAGGIQYDPRLSVQSEFTVDSGYNAAQELCSRGIPFDAVMCATDTIAFGVKQCFFERGIRIPDDVKIASIGDSKMSSVVKPSLTTAHLHYTTGGMEACKIMLEELTGSTKITKQYKLGFDICRRESTAPHIK